MIKIEAALPQILRKQLDSPEFDDEAAVVIDAVRFDERLHLEFSLRYYHDETPPQKWLLTVDNYEDERIVRDWTQSIALYSEHPRLLEYNDAHTELYFNGTTSQYLDLYADINQALTTLTDDLDEIKTSVFLPNDIQVLSQQRYGLFARGSETILSLYQQCLVKYGIQAYFVGKHPVNRGENAAKLFVIGDSYVIGRHFHFEQL